MGAVARHLKCAQLVADTRMHPDVIALDTRALSTRFAADNSKASLPKMLPAPSTSPRLCLGLVGSIIESCNSLTHGVVSRCRYPFFRCGTVLHQSALGARIALHGRAATELDWPSVDCSILLVRARLAVGCSILENRARLAVGCSILSCSRLV